MSLRRFDQLIGSIRQRLGAFHDRRTGKNKKYTMEDIALSAFSVFYTQCPSFLASPEDHATEQGPEQCPDPVPDRADPLRQPCPRHTRRGSARGTLPDLRRDLRGAARGGNV